MGSVNTIYLAFYKDKGNWQDKLIRFFTKGKYSHCEIVVETLESWGQYDYRPIYRCYSSSPRDGGVRRKAISLTREKWDFIHIPCLTETQIEAYFVRTSGAKYDWWGTLGMVLGIKHKRSKYFCSEWCFNAIFNSEEGWRFNPNQLAVIVQNKLGK